MAKKRAGIPVEILEAYLEDVNKVEVVPLGGGSINLTFLVKTCHGAFILQRINKGVFPCPETVVNNFALLHQHLQTKSSTGIAPLLAKPHLSLGKTLAVTDHQGFLWRGQEYLEGAGWPKRAKDHRFYRSLGHSLALFHNLTHDLETKTLGNPLPGFHDLSGYLKAYDALDLGQQREGSCKDEIGGLREDLMDRYLYLVDSQQKMPVHGDPRLENFIFDDRGMANGLLDLDTVGPGYILFDLGDCLRSCWVDTAAQGYKLGSMGGLAVDFTIAESLVGAYLETAEHDLKRENAPLIFDGIVILCFELGLRFVTDHLLGDIYFKADHHGANLERGRVQLALCRALLEDEMVLKRKISSLFSSAVSCR